MKKLCLLLVIGGWWMSFPAALSAQEGYEMTAEMKLRTLGQTYRVSIANGIAYAKKMGQTPEDYGRFFAEQLQPNIAPVVKGNVQAFFNLVRNHALSTHPDYELKIQRQSDEMVRARWQQHGQALPPIKVPNFSPEDMGTWRQGFYGALAEHLELEFMVEEKDGKEYWEVRLPEEDGDR